MARFEYSGEMKEWMKENYLLPRGELTTKFNENFSVNRSRENINQLRRKMGLTTGRTGSFPKGHHPWHADTKGLTKSNSGTFKKGQVTNKCQVGAERVRDGYVYIKLANGKWRQKHRVIWEARHGEIPKNKYIIFKDGNARNCEINNLIMVSYAENIILNRFYHAIPEIYKQTAINLARIKIAIANKEK